MKVFISWSGDVSNKVAMVLRDWLPSVIQAIEPYVSSEDIDKGARWSTDIAKELEASRFGIICITKENIEAAWLNFEAGALSKTIDKSRVCPFLFGLKRSEIRTGPLLQFQSTIYEKDDLSKLLHSINNSVEPHCIDESRLDSVFEVWWPKLKESLDPHLSSSTKMPSQPAVPTKRERNSEQSDILEELLELARKQNKLLNSPEEILPPDYLDHLLRRTHQDVNPEALEDLYRSWKRLRDLLGDVNPDDPLRPVLIEAVERLDRPIDYLLHTLGMHSPSRRMRRIAEVPKFPPK